MTTRKTILRQFSQLVLLTIAVTLLAVCGSEVTSNGEITTTADSSSTPLILYASAFDQRLDKGELFSIDLTTGAVTKIGDLGFIINGLAYDSDNDILYGVGGGQGTSISYLFRINRTTGAATPVGPLGSVEFFGLAYDATRHQLFATNQTGLYTVNSSTGQATLVGSISLPTAATRELTFDIATDTLFLGTEGVVDGVDVNGLNTIDRDTGELTFLGTYKAGGDPRLFNNVRGIEFDLLQSRLLGIDTSDNITRLLMIDSSNGAASVLMNLLNFPNLSLFFGLAFAPPVPTSPPVITITATPETLWPPNGKLVPVTIAGTIMDAGSGVKPSTAAYVVTDEYRQVQPKGSVDLRADGNYSFTIQLQASRNDNDKDGRQYIITVSAQDTAGNTGSAATGVTVPHDLGQ
jgi:hypothetical protein